LVTLFKVDLTPQNKAETKSKAVPFGSAVFVEASGLIPKYKSSLKKFSRYQDCYGLFSTNVSDEGKKGLQHSHLTESSLVDEEDIESLGR
jgi:hypothetical protein